SPGPAGGLPASGMARRLAQGGHRVLLVRRLSWPRPARPAGPVADQAGPARPSLAAAGRRLGGAGWHEIRLGQVEPQRRLTEDRVPVAHRDLRAAWAL